MGKTTDNEVFDKIKNMNLNDEIKNQKQYMKLNINFDSYKHILKNHLNLNSKELQGRIKLEHKKFASTFIGKYYDLVKTIENSIIEEMTNFPDCFFGWIFDDSDWNDYEITFTLPKNIKGIAYSSKKEHNWKKGPLICTKGKICLFKTDYKMWNIRTTYLLLPNEI